MRLYAAMTVNESSLVHAWSRIQASAEARDRQDRARIIVLSMRVELAAEQAAFTADTTLVNPG